MFHKGRASRPAGQGKKRGGEKKIPRSGLPTSEREKGKKGKPVLATKEAGHNCVE